jgi:hypothetical protein
MRNSGSIRWKGHIACMGEIINTRKILVEKPQGNRPLGRPRYRWEDHIRSILKK